MEKKVLQISSILQRFKPTDQGKIVEAFAHIARAHENDTDVNVSINVNGNRHFKINVTLFNVGSDKTR